MGKFFSRKSRFSLRKLSVGLASVYLGSVMFVQSPTVLAEGPDTGGAESSLQIAKEKAEESIQSQPSVEAEQANIQDRSATPATEESIQSQPSVEAEPANIQDRSATPATEESVQSQPSVEAEPANTQDRSATPTAEESVQNQPTDKLAHPEATQADSQNRSAVVSEETTEELYKRIVKELDGLSDKYKEQVEALKKLEHTSSTINSMYDLMRKSLLESEADQSKNISSTDKISNVNLSLTFRVTDNNNNNNDDVDSGNIGQTIHPDGQNGKNVDYFHTKMSLAFSDVRAGEYIDLKLTNIDFQGLVSTPLVTEFKDGDYTVAIGYYQPTSNSDQVMRIYFTDYAEYKKSGHIEFSSDAYVNRRVIRNNMNDVPFSIALGPKKIEHKKGVEYSALQITTSTGYGYNQGDKKEYYETITKFFEVDPQKSTAKVAFLTGLQGKEDDKKIEVRWDLGTSQKKGTDIKSNVNITKGNLKVYKLPVKNINKTQIYDVTRDNLIDVTEEYTKNAEWAKNPKGADRVMIKVGYTFPKDYALLAIAEVPINLSGPNYAQSSVGQNSKWWSFTTDYAYNDSGSSLIFGGGDASADTPPVTVQKIYSLGDHVWVDNNKDGIYQETDTPKSDVIVELYNQYGEKIAVTKTDKDGKYKFEKLSPGLYSVNFVKPEGYDFTVQADSQNNQDEKSDVKPTGERVPVLIKDKDRLDIDAGLVEVKKGSVIVNYVDTDGTKIGTEFKDTTDQPAGTDYTTTEDKGTVASEQTTERPSEITTKDGKTYVRVQAGTYTVGTVGSNGELTETKVQGLGVDSPTGKVEADKTKSITYVYKLKEEPKPEVKKGSVIVNYVDTDGTKIGTEFKDTTDQPAGTDYTTTEDKGTVASEQTTERPSEITTKDGKTYVRVQAGTYTVGTVGSEGELKETKVQGLGVDSPTGKVEADKTKSITYVYKLKEEPKPEVKKGSVVITYVDTEGNELKTQVQDTTNKPVGEDYDTKENDNEYPSEIVKDGKTYVRVQAGDYKVGKTTEDGHLTSSDDPTGKVEKGTKKVTYVYKLKEDPKPNDLKPVPEPKVQKPKTTPTVTEEEPKKAEGNAKVLPNTGEESSASLAAAGVAILTGLGMLGVSKKRRKD